MTKNANDPVALAVTALASSRKKSSEAERDFGSFAYHLWHVITDVERMGDAFQIGPDWMVHDATKGREAVVNRCMQILFPVPDNVQASKDKNLKAAHRMEQQANRTETKVAVEMLAGMARMGDMFGSDGAQWDGSQWLVPASWFVREGVIDRVFLSGQKGKMHKGEHVPLLTKNAAHTARIIRQNKAGDDVEAFVQIRPNRTSIGALGKPVQEREQSEDASAEVSPTRAAGNMFAKLLDQSMDEVSPVAILGDAADALEDIIQRIVRSNDWWTIALAEREKFKKEMEADTKAA